MTQLVDGDAQRRVTQLIEKLTDKRKFAIEPELSRDLKWLCRASDANLSAAFDALSEQLNGNHAQTRVLALELINELFTRSKLFRSLLAAQFTTFLEAAVGFRPEKPLPPPAPAAAILRIKALEFAERWNETFGSFYPQIGFGCKYLKDTLQFSFPEARERAAAAFVAAHERQVRSQQLVQERYLQIQGNFDSTVLEMESTLHQMDEALAILETTNAVAEDDIGWENVEDLTVDYDAEDNGMGLSAYAAVESAPLEGTRPDAMGAGTDETGSSEAAKRAVLETIRGCYKLIVNRHLPTVQRWLKVMVKVDAGASGTAEYTDRERILRKAIDMRASLSEGQGKYEMRRSIFAVLEAQGVSPAGNASTLPEQPDPSLAGTAQQTGSRRTGIEMREDAEAIIESARLHALLRDPTVGRSTWTLSGGEMGKPPSSAQIVKRIAADKVTMSKHLKSGSPSRVTESERVGAASSGPAGRAPVRRPDGHMGLPESTKRDLLMKAPVMPAGLQLDYWEGGASMGAARSGMEIQNHWGAVDAHVQLSAEQLAELGAHHVAQYYRAPSATTAVKPIPSADSSALNITADHPLPDTDLHSRRLSRIRSQLPAVTHIGRPPIHTLKANRSAISISSADTALNHPASAELLQGPSAQQIELHGDRGPTAGLCATAFQPISSTEAGRRKISQRSADSAHNIETLKYLDANDTAFTAELEPQEGQMHDKEKSQASITGKRKAQGNLQQRLEMFKKSNRGEGPALSRPSRGFVFIR